MVRIRLRRVGAKNQPSYRIVVTDQRSPRDGRFIEVIGFYNPRTDPETYKIDEARALYWLEKGAQPSDSVVRLMKTHGTYDRYQRLRAGEPLESLVAEAAETPQKAAPARQKAAAEPAPAASEVHEEAEATAEVDAAAEASAEVEAAEAVETEEADAAAAGADEEEAEAEAAE